MNDCPSGAKRNCPSDPHAVASPIAEVRRSGGTSRAKAASTIVNDAPDRPRPISTPPVRYSEPGVVLVAINAVPAAWSTAPPASTWRTPKRSASPPAIGWPMPHSRFWIAIASAKTSRSHPRASESGSVKRPKDVRTP